MLGLSKLFGRETISYLYSCVQSKKSDFKVFVSVQSQECVWYL